MSNMYILNTINELTEREMEVLERISAGKSNVQIANELIISKSTAKAHVSSILQKLNATDRTQAVVRAIKYGILQI